MIRRFQSQHDKHQRDVSLDLNPAHVVSDVGKAGVPGAIAAFRRRQRPCHWSGMRGRLRFPTFLSLLVFIPGLPRIGECDDQQPADADLLRVIRNSIGMKLTLIPAGEFSMGSADTDEDAGGDEKPQHRVNITKRFYMGVFEVTQEEYNQVMGEKPSYFAQSGRGHASVIGLDTSRFPVEKVFATKAIEFCEKLSELPDEKANGRVYRLPTEAEWEYACRAGSDTDFGFGDSLSSLQANFNGNLATKGAEKGPFLGRPTTVGSYRPNDWGLYDMHGNVSESVLDNYNAEYYKDSPPDDPQQTEHGPGRVFRGGAWGNDAQACRSAFRDHVIDGYRYRTRGFRVILEQWDKLSPAESPEVVQLDRVFHERVRPFLKSHCFDCHSGEEPEGSLALDTFQRTLDIATTGRKTWKEVRNRLRAGTMPPPEEERPLPEEIEGTGQWIEDVLATVQYAGPSDPGHETIRRLNRVEYRNTVRDLLGIDFQADFPIDDVGGTGATLTLPPLLMERYVAAASQLSEQATSITKGVPDHPAAYERIFVALPDENRSSADAARGILTPLASRAYRRPATEKEVKRLLELFEENSLAEESGFEAGIGSALEAILVSPHFLFKVELDSYPHDPRAVRELNEFELATRMSYFLWSSMPDEELLEHARQGTLQSNLESQVLRMLEDPKAAALMEHFGGHWLELPKLLTVEPDKQLFPEFDDELRDDMLTETQMFLEAIMREDRSLLDLLDADFTFLNKRLARHYGIDGVEGAEFVRVALGDDAPRGGLLTLASVLTYTSNPDRTSPVKRGKFILEFLLGEPPPAPPDEIYIPELDKADPEVQALSLRKQMEVHRENPTCAACHQKMDVLGFAFENFDAIGRWRTKDGEFPINASGTLPGGLEFEGAQQLRALFRDQLKADFVWCLTEKMLSYALGRELEYYDEPALDEIFQSLSINDYRFSILIREIIGSEPFLKRRGQRKGTP